MATKTTKKKKTPTLSPGEEMIRLVEDESIPDLTSYYAEETEQAFEGLAESRETIFKELSDHYKQFVIADELGSTNFNNNADFFCDYFELPLEGKSCALENLVYSPIPIPKKTEEFYQTDLSELFEQKIYADTRVIIEDELKLTTYRITSLTDQKRYDGIKGLTLKSTKEVKDCELFISFIDKNIAEINKPVEWLRMPLYISAKLNSTTKSGNKLWDINPGYRLNIIESVISKNPIKELLARLILQDVDITDKNEPILCDKYNDFFKKVTELISEEENKRNLIRTNPNKHIYLEKSSALFRTFDDYDENRAVSYGAKGVTTTKAVATTPTPKILEGNLLMFLQLVSELVQCTYSYFFRDKTAAFTRNRGYYYSPVSRIKTPARYKEDLDALFNGERKSAIIAYKANLVKISKERGITLKELTDELKSELVMRKLAAKKHLAMKKYVKENQVLPKLLLTLGSLYSEVEETRNYFNDPMNRINLRNLESRMSRLDDIRRVLRSVRNDK